MKLRSNKLGGKKQVPFRQQTNATLSVKYVISKPYHNTTYSVIAGRVDSDQSGLREVFA